MRFHGRVLLAAVLAVPLSSCAMSRALVSTLPEPSDPSQYLTTGAGAPAGRTDVSRSDRHVIVISIDGLRPDAIDQYDAPTLQRLKREGRYSLSAKTILPSITLPSHTSMITGVEPDVHGITWNDNRVDEKGRVPVPTMLATAQEHGLSAAAIVSKGKFNHLLEPGTLDYFIVPEGNGSWSAGSTADKVEDYLAEGRPNLLFVHIREPDRYGHIFGWMGYFYGWAVRQSDRAVRDILESADRAFGPGNYTVLLTADHGGHGWGHGSEDPRSVHIPWIAWGKDVGSPGEIDAEIRTVDTAATALWLLGVPIPDRYSGSPVVAAFSTTARVDSLAGE